MQLCAGYEAGCEADIHAVDWLFSNENTDVVLSVDAKNVSSLLNKEVFIHNVKIICPAFAAFVSNWHFISFGYLLLEVAIKIYRQCKIRGPHNYDDIGYCNYPIYSKNYRNDRWSPM